MDSGVEEELKVMKICSKFYEIVRSEIYLQWLWWNVNFEIVKSEGWESSNVLNRESEKMSWNWWMWVRSIYIGDDHSIMLSQIMLEVSQILLGFLLVCYSLPKLCWTLLPNLFRFVMRSVIVCYFCYDLWSSVMNCV